MSSKEREDANATTKIKAAMDGSVVSTGALPDVSRILVKISS